MMISYSSVFYVLWIWRLTELPFSRRQTTRDDLDLEF